jgi:hypothetical protein
MEDHPLDSGWRTIIWSGQLLEDHIWTTTRGQSSGMNNYWRTTSGQNMRTIIRTATQGQSSGHLLEDHNLENDWMTVIWTTTRGPYHLEWTTTGRLSSGLYNYWRIDWLIDYLGFYVLLKNFSLIWRRHNCWWRAAKFRPVLGAQGLWTGRDLYRATPVVTRDLGFSGLIRRTTPFSRLLPHEGMWRIYSNPDPHGDALLDHYLENDWITVIWTTTRGQSSRQWLDHHLDHGWMTCHLYNHWKAITWSTTAIPPSVQLLDDNHLDSTTTRR